MPISNKYEHGDMVVIYSNPLVIGKILTPDKCIAPNDIRFWKQVGPRAYSLKNNWILVRWENRQHELLKDTDVVPLPAAVRILYGKT